MSIDPKGTTPGLAKEPEVKEVNMRCKNHPKCNSITATELKIGAQPGTHIYRCTKCGHTHRVTLGGAAGF